MKQFFVKLAKKNTFFRFFIVELIYFSNRDIKSDEKIFEKIQKFVPKERYTDKKYMKKMYKDLLYLKYICKIAHFDEYFMYDLYSKSNKQWREYVFSDEYLKACKPLLGEEKDDDYLLGDKYMGYITLKDYYKRDVVKLASFEDYPAFDAFIRKHDEFMLKLNRGSLGKNIMKYNVQETNVRNLFMTAIAKEEWVVEEIIAQDDAMASLHPQSLNTVRIATYRENNSITKIFAMLRMGSGGSVVDNASNGGICARVNIETGIVESIGYKKNGEVIEIHPDTNIIIKGFKIPRWGELMALCDEVALFMPIYRYVGWDFALSENDGWVIVEGNNRPNINSIQMCSGRGLRKDLEKALGKIENMV